VAPSGDKRIGLPRALAAALGLALRLRRASVTALLYAPDTCDTLGDADGKGGAGDRVRGLRRELRATGGIATMMVTRVALIVGLASSTGCTLGAMGVTSSTIALHNDIADDRSQWSYGTPLLVSAAIGLACDVVFLVFFAKAWSRPMT